MEQRPDKVITDPVLVELLLELRRVLGPKPKKRRKLVAEPYREPELTPEQIEKRTRKEARAKLRDQGLRGEVKPSRRRASAKAVATPLPRVRCPDCGTPIPRLEGEAAVPGLCTRCAARMAEAEGTFRRRERTEFLDISIVPGGAPGMGKRK